MCFLEFSYLYELCVFTAWNVLDGGKANSEPRGRISFVQFQASPIVEIRELTSVDCLINGIVGFFAFPCDWLIDLSDFSGLDRWWGIFILQRWTTEDWLCAGLPNGHKSIRCQKDGQKGQFSGPDGKSGNWIWAAQQTGMRKCFEFLFSLYFFFAIIISFWGFLAGPWPSLRGSALFCKVACNVGFVNEVRKYVFMRHSKAR